ncbi:MAG: hypothetical protein RI911_676 [Candidatus Parcubacteria bacterium]|jgi:predicted GH43/DUF377 family glycosyl hydrolase
MEPLWLLLPIIIAIILFFAGVFHKPQTRGESVLQEKNKTKKKSRQLVRSSKNPLMTPHTHNEWETHAVFNPAVIFHNGVVHMLYRAMGHDGVSRVGYATSTDGIHFTRHYNRPVFVPQLGKGIPLKKNKLSRQYNRKKNPSGGGWAGCEDPRIVHIGDTFYMTYVAFDGWGFIRMAMTSISEADFMAGQWNWAPSVLLSPPNEIHKNWLLFPEKIQGKFAIVHSIHPEIEIEYVDALEEFDSEKRFISSGYNRSIKTKGRWDTWVRGAGPPPVKTDAGWLVLYHGIQEGETHKYKLGAMLLDLDDPTKVIGRLKHPLLEPDTWYENHGKPGIVYASGTIVKGDTLYVYYGAGDTSVCVATIPLNDLIQAIIRGTDAQQLTEAVHIA